MIVDKRETSSEPLTAGSVFRWGEPPLALLPAPLAQRLASIPLPQWLAQVFDGPATSVAALQADAWHHLPADPVIRDRIRTYVLDLVAAHAVELNDVPIAGREVRSVAALVSRWPGRARNSLLRSGVGRDPTRLGSLTFGQLLDERNIGVKTALETAALLQIFLPADSTRAGGDSPPRTLPDTATRWGEPGSPLLPETLRRAFANEVLPTWLLRDLHLPGDATPLSLDASVWRRIDALPPRAERYLIGLMTYRASDIRDIRVIEGVWPFHIVPGDVPWPTRVHNSLLRAGLLDPARLESVTYGDLLAIPAMGVKSALEFAAMADTVAAPVPAVVLDEAARQELMIMAEEEWAERVRADDPRFRDVVPPYAGSLSDMFEGALNDPESRLAHAISASLPAISARVGEIAAETIDEAMARILSSMGVAKRDVAIVMSRFGWAGHRARSLRAVGAEFSMSGERIRQLVDNAIAKVWQAYLPQIEQAVQLLTDRAPLTADAAAQLLVKEGLATVPIDPTALATMAELVGYEVGFHVDPSDGAGYVLAEGLTGTGPIFAAARREAGRVGVSNIEEIQAELDVRGEAHPPDAISRILRSSTKVQFLYEDWFWMPDIPLGRNRLRNVSQRMLSVTPRLDVPTLRQGVRRRYRFMRIDLVPPINVLTAFYAAHPEFVLREDGTVELAIPLDYRETLGEAEQAFVEALRASPTGLMDRAELEEAVTRRGTSASTFSVFTTYSPILDHPANNIWSLRGHAPDPAQLEALRAVLATRSRHRRTLAYAWAEDGSLRLTIEVANVGSPVISIPTDISRYVAGRRFQAWTQEGTPAGTIAVDERGVSWGYGPFLGRRGAEPGDALTIRFDLAAETVTLSLDDGTALIEEAG